MRDSFQREINYMRISITDRCNLRCQYCMPEEGLPLAEHGDVLRYEEFLSVVSAAVELGITRFKITGGEPLARRGCVAFIRQMKEIAGVEQVTLTTNAILLPPVLDQLVEVGVDGINISLDTLDDGQFAAITRRNYTASQVVEAIRESGKRVKTKINAVLLPETANQLIPLAQLAEHQDVDVRFIQQMPIGHTLCQETTQSALERLRAQWPDLQETAEKRGNGPARYFKAAGLQGRIGLIEAMNHQFCHSCNRIRLTSTGELKPCLCYEEGVDLRPMLRSEAGENALRSAIAQAIVGKPQAHCFGTGTEIREHRSMNQIGG